MSGCSTDCGDDTRLRNGNGWKDEAIDRLVKEEVEVTEGVDVE